MKSGRTCQRGRDGRAVGAGGLECGRVGWDGVGAFVLVSCCLVERGHQRFLDVSFSRVMKHSSRVERHAATRTS